MKGMVVITYLAAAAAPSVVTVTAPPPPPPPVILAPPPPAYTRSRDEIAPSLLDIAVTAGREALWSGSLRVGSSGANFSQQLRETPESCAGKSAGDEGRYAESSRQLSVGLSRRGGRERPDTFTVNIRWTRPVAACEGGGSRSVSLDQQVEIAPGQTVHLSGDAGLAIVLTRKAR